MSVSESKIDLALRKAHLLVARGCPDDALLLLRDLQARCTDADIEELVAEVRSARDRARRDDSARRAVRYNLRLQTSFGRLVWALCAVAAVAYGLWSAGAAAQAGMARGLAATITTWSTDQFGHRHAYTRPVSADLIVGALVAVAGGSGLYIVWYASRGAADWEELDATSSRESADDLI